MQINLVIVNYFLHMLKGINVPLF